MAKLNNLHYGIQPPTFNSVDTPIGGKLLIAQLIIPELELLYKKESDIKYELATKLAEGMLNCNFVQFTKMDDPISLDRIFRARCFVAESGDIRILRTVTRT